MACHLSSSDKAMTLAMRQTSSTFLMAALALRFANAHALEPIAGNINANTTDTGYFNTLGASFSQSFTTGSMTGFGDVDGDGIALLNVTVNLEAGKAFGYDPSIDDFGYISTGTTYRVDLCSDAAGTPGGSILFQSIQETVYGPGLTTFSLGQFAPSLQSHTTYWISIEFTGGDAGIAIAPLLYETSSAATSGSGALGSLLYSSDGQNWGGASSRALILISGEATVPEPSAYGVLFGGLALACALVGRRRQAHA